MFNCCLVKVGCASRVLAVLALVCTFAILPAQNRKTIYVSPTGNDNNPGYPSARMKTVHAAVQRMHDEIARGSGLSYTIDVAPGRYEFDRPIHIWENDGGTAVSPLIIRGWEGTVFDGSIQITGWRKVAGDAWRRLSMSARRNVFMAPIPLQDNGSGQMVPVDTGAMNQRGGVIETQQTWSTLVFNGSPMTLAKYPNYGWLHTPADHDGSSTSFRLTNNVLYSWVNTGDVWIQGFLGWDWADSYERISHVDTVNGRVHLATQPTYGITSNKRYRVVNALEALDMPGEYFIDRQNGGIYFYPPLNGLDDATKLAHLESGTFMPVQDETLIQTFGTSNVIFQNITFQNGRGTGVQIRSGENVVFTGCTFKNFNRDGAILNMGNNHRFQSCNFSDIGERALTVRGGDRTTLAPSGHVVENCWFRDFSDVVLAYRPAVSLHGVGHQVVRNRFEDAPHSAIRIRGNDHQIISNYISRVCLETNDAGAIYIGRNMTYQGNVVKFNKLEDIWTRLEGNYGTNFAAGVYLDDLASGSDVSSNVFKNVQAGVLVGGGRDNIMDNNLFFGNDHAFHFDARGTTWASGFIQDWNVAQMYAEVPYQSTTWVNKYGDIGLYLTDQPGVPMRNSATRNVTLWTSQWMLLLDGLQLYSYPGTDAPVYESLNFIAQWNPGFFNISKDDYRFFSYSSLNRYQITPLDFSTTGLYLDSYRHSLPHNTSISRL